MKDPIDFFFNKLRWPLPALLVWAVAWCVYLLVLQGDLPAAIALGLASLCGAGASALGLKKQVSLARIFALVLGFPVSLWLSGTTHFPYWLWLLPLLLALWIYPMHAWRDAPIFPTPLHALKDLTAHASLSAQALILDAGCGAGDGLKALRLAYPEARLVGIEFSRPLQWLARLRCPWAMVRLGDIWQEPWAGYDMVYFFQRPETMPRAVAKARAEMKPGTWLVSLEFMALELKPTAVVAVNAKRNVWLYQAPFIDA
ncbi:MAG: class I SAM-dependent methyltransferase [Betaproteobacteria bacterium]